MGYSSTSHADSISDADLADRLVQLRDDPALWRAVLGRQVLAEARSRFSRLSIACGLDAADGATFAWQFWTQKLTDAALCEHRDRLWKFTAGAIRRSMTVEDIAQSRLISTRAARDVKVVGLDTPLRFNSAEDLTGVSIAALTTDPFSDEEEQLAPVRGIGGRQAVSAVRQLLVMAGLTPDQRDSIFSEIARQLSDTTTLRAAAEALHRSPAPDAALPAERWKALVTLVVGTAKGSPGLVHLIGQGHPSPMTEPHIQRLIPVFLQRPGLAAAGVA